MTVKMGPVKASFKGAVTLSDLDPPNGYRISGEGKSMMGGATGGANVRLEEVPEGTKLIYDVDAQVTGKIASLAQRFIEPTARQLSAQFFEKFAKLAGGGTEKLGAAARLYLPAPPVCSPSRVR